LVIPKACTRFHKLTQYWETNPPHSGYCVEALKVDSSVIRISQRIRSWTDCEMSLNSTRCWM